MEPLDHTSERNELSSSGSFTCETSKNLNCHLEQISIAIAVSLLRELTGVTGAIIYRPISNSILLTGAIVDLARCGWNEPKISQQRHLHVILLAAVLCLARATPFSISLRPSVPPPFHQLPLSHHQHTSFAHFRHLYARYCAYQRKLSSAVFSPRGPGAFLFAIQQARHPATPSPTITHRHLLRIRLREVTVRSPHLNNTRQRFGAAQQ